MTKELAERVRQLEAELAANNVMIGDEPAYAIVVDLVLALGYAEEEASYRGWVLEGLRK